ncbi:MAG: hypothetical protein CENE_02590 [Candidatus Celerinatantimonas neptuna]|nr:MAG: hypothetical protein CENE_02590 [Candidatus Celerinatantimonas neptuna]
MQIDGHHTYTYIAARYGGLSHDDAATVAYAAQYVDEAIHDQPIYFSNGAMYQRIASAHKMLDYRNLPEIANHLSWLPFHFLPGNGEYLEDEKIDVKERFIYRLLCAEDSKVVRQLLAYVLGKKGKPYSLHWLGIALHIYADTFSHQGFAGVSHVVNRVEDLDNLTDQGMDGYFNRIRDNSMAWVVSTFEPLGHGAALSMPDLPYLKFQYKDGLGRIISRDNTAIFMRAIDLMCKVIQCYNSNETIDHLDEQLGLPEDMKPIIRKKMESFCFEDPDKRHQLWLEEIGQGQLGFENESLHFSSEGAASWKQQARGEGQSMGEFKQLVQYTFSEQFLSSDWKYFHDGLKHIRLYIVSELLPQYGICVG